MIRQTIRGLLALALLTLAVDATARQPGGPPDKIVIRDKKDGSTRSYDGFLQFGPTGLQIVSTEKKVLVPNLPPADVVRVSPAGDIPGVDRSAVLSLLSAEEKAKNKADYEKARLGYDDLRKKTAGAPERAKRYVDFKLAQMTTKVADETGYDERWAETAAEAAKAWAGFLAEYKGGWESWPAARAATRLYAEMNKFDEAARVWGRLTKKDAELPPDLRLEAGLQEVDAQIRSKAFGPAQAAAEALGKAAPAGQAKDRLAIYEIAARAAANADYDKGVKDIEAKIAETKDPVVRGTGYSMLGELYLAAAKPRDAMWSFLWVETVYNADRDEAFKALCRLVEAFKAQNDEDRVRAYQEKLQRTRGTF